MDDSCLSTEDEMVVLLLLHNLLGLSALANVCHLEESTLGLQLRIMLLVLLLMMKDELRDNTQDNE